LPVGLFYCLQSEVVLIFDQLIWAFVPPFPAVCADERV
jgi:hypothetical protein